MTELAEHTCTHDELELSSKGKGSLLKSRFLALITRQMCSIYSGMRKIKRNSIHRRVLFLDNKINLRGYLASKQKNSEVLSALGLPSWLRW